MISQNVLLGVNIDHSATLRQARYRENPLDRGRMVEPDPVDFALAAQRAGADGITLHLREDRRHIQDSDVYRMIEMIQVPMNLEMAATEEMAKIACEVKPAVVLLVPESREEVTTEGGLDVIKHQSRVKDVIAAMKANGIATSLFIDPEAAQIDMAAELEAEFVELHTGAFANVFYGAGMDEELTKLKHGAVRAHDAGLKVNAGHGINYSNIKHAREIPWLHEMNIGHSIVSRSLFVGVNEAVREMKALMNGIYR
ncbi:pyridoxine 5'-phosphate synthase [Cerasicoccus maritimus]|uniref:pyridoxine 5'-phosphate synthase n=1 Tax=Cerasicoccus maritimus TaxID=490089 RepID=UPI002852854E|nr:pyridoxine 5'-phosphate synthase [Cerasicoccus maritimus]